MTIHIRSDHTGMVRPYDYTDLVQTMRNTDLIWNISILNELPTADIVIGRDILTKDHYNSLTRDHY